jgi:hypothetical protein
MAARHRLAPRDQKQPMALESIPAYFGFRGGQLRRAYNEAAFRHFLAVDRLRADHSTRSILLVLASLRQSVGRSAMLTDAAAAALFCGLGECVREVDFVGWYREGYVAAAVLWQGVNPSRELPHVIVQRLLPALRKRLPIDQSRNLRVRVVRLGGRASV